MTSSNTLGKYEIIREIARSNDIVYEARDPKLGRRVALKELNLPSNLTGAQRRERIERFLREGKAAAKLTHPNIVTVYDVGQEGDRFYIAMEYLEGLNLRETMQASGPLSVQDAIDITIQLCNALAESHRNNIVHRDIKPENVQILPGGHIKLTDFGIARIMSEPSITANGQVFGTPGYMSPEQVSGRAVDGRSDIFSVGVLLYEMLTGQKPFAGDTVVTITYNIMNSEPAPPPGVPPHLVQIIRKAMSKDPNMRFQTIDEMIDQLKNPAPSSPFYGADPYVSSPTGYAPTYGGPAQPTSDPPPTTYAPPGYAPGQVGQNVPDPFGPPPPSTGQSQGAPPAYVPPPPMPHKPILSQETKSFLGLLFLLMGLAGMLVFAIWVTMEAYSSYVDRAAGQTVSVYIMQGDKLFQQGNIQGAIEQYKSAVAAAGNTKASERARRSLATAYSELASRAYAERDYVQVGNHATLAIQADPTASSGHYWLGESKLRLGDRKTAEAEFREAVKVGGNDQFAIASRRTVSQMLIQDGDFLRAQNRPEKAKRKYEDVVELQDPDAVKVAQDRLSEM